MIIPRHLICIPSFLFGFLIILSSCQRHSNSEKLTIAVAANARFALDSLTKRFAQIYPVKVDIVSTSSGKLAAQIREGAPYDLFFSADSNYVHFLLESGMAIQPIQQYAFGKLVLVSAIDFKSQTWDSFLLNFSGKIAIANPKLAPYGQLTQKLLRSEGILTTIEPKLVMGESIAQVNQLLLSEAVPIGFTSRSTMSLPAFEAFHTIPLPLQNSAGLPQFVAMTAYGNEHHPELSNLFLNFIKQPESIAIFEYFGYRIPTE